MPSFEDHNTLQHVTSELADMVSTITSSTPSDFRVSSPPLSSYSSGTSVETNVGSESTPSNRATTIASPVLAVGREPGVAFNLVDWGWQQQEEEQVAVGGSTPRQRTLSLPRINHNHSNCAPLRPIPPEVPESCPSLYRPGPGSLVNEDEDEDDMTEAESIWFCNEDSDAFVQLSASAQPFPNPIVDAQRPTPEDQVLFNPPEEFDDFPDLAIIIGALQATTEDMIVEGAIEDLNAL